MARERRRMSLSSQLFNLPLKPLNKMVWSKKKLKLRYNWHSAAAAAKSLQSCPTLCNPIDGSPPGSSIHGTLQARTLECVTISFSNAWKWKVRVKSLSRVRLCDPMDCSPPGSSVHGTLQARALEWGASAFSNWHTTLYNSFFYLHVFSPTFLQFSQDTIKYSSHLFLIIAVFLYRSLTEKWKVKFHECKFLWKGSWRSAAGHDELLLFSL